MVKHKLHHQGAKKIQLKEKTPIQILEKDLYILNKMKLKKITPIKISEKDFYILNQM